MATRAFSVDSSAVVPASAENASTGNPQPRHARRPSNHDGAPSTGEGCANVITSAMVVLGTSTRPPVTGNMTPRISRGRASAMLMADLFHFRTRGIIGARLAVGVSADPTFDRVGVDP